MNSDFLKTTALKLMIALLSALATKFHLDASGSQITAFATDAVDIGFIVWSLYRSYRMKLAPEKSIVVKTTNDQAIKPSVGDHVTITQRGDNPTSGVETVGKVVGTVLIASLVLMSHSAVAFELRGGSGGGGAVQTADMAGDVLKARDVSLLGSKLTSIVDTLKVWTSADIAAAIDLSQATDIKDDVGATCWRTFASLGQLIEKHPLPLSLKVASDVQAARLLSMSLKKVCQEPACAQVWMDMQNQVSALMPIAVPFTLASICSKIP